MTVRASDGHHSVNAFIVVDDAEQLIGFLAAAFDALECERIDRPDGRIGHGEVRLGDSIVMVTDASEEFPARACAHYLYVDDVDLAHERAIASGATSLREPADRFYGNREAAVLDPFGNLWWIASEIEQVSPDEVQRRWEASGRRSSL